ncbi:hypothetical protein GXM_10371 [Nostoc sphaeroides CCNUC1]|uniref:Uncharacterized protein n=1 Tax=Nostoc sphaeroides CCNUC1 TaxID=2653204 RepID=A0A5P8WKC8_9NOSO|nr:hypothetical protein GXM_10371 [Nostoc sphaeroides CCNUC1]
MLELLRGNVYIYLQLPCLPLAVASLYKSDRHRKERVRHRLKNALTHKAYDNQGNSS